MSAVTIGRLNLNFNCWFETDTFVLPLKLSVAPFPNKCRAHSKCMSADASDIFIVGDDETELLGSP